METNRKSSKKDLILDTARQIFSQKGYDDSSMDEIAANSGVTKSLIYYHFKSKEVLLQEVINQFFCGYQKLLDEDQQPGVEKYLKFLEDNNDFVRVIISESIKKGKPMTAIFKVVELVMQCLSRVSEDDKWLDYEKSHERWVAEFFTSIAPFIMFSCYEDVWCDYFHTDRSQLRRDFLSVYSQTHGEYHKRF